VTGHPIVLIALDQPNAGEITAHREGESSFTHVSGLGDAMQAALTRGVDLVVPANLAEVLFRDFPSDSELPEWIKIR
jgi:hypothetical protein